MSKTNLEAVSEALEVPGSRSERLLGAHMPTAGGLHKALLGGKEIGCTAVQLFTGSPRQWSHPPLEAVAIATFREAQEQTDIPFMVAHDSYLINLAAPDPLLLEKSRNAFRKELDRAEQLGIPWVVTHMGAHLGQGEAEATARLIESLKQILDETDRAGYRVGVALETTAGQGTGLGWRFEQLGEILQGVGEHLRLGVCLDTCHVFAAGYDLRTAETYTQTWARFAEIVGLDRLKVIHVNDSKKPLGSRVDRHDHLGVGEIGSEAFARLVNDPRLCGIPMIVETPDAETMHTVNLQLLRRLASVAADTIRVKVLFFGHYGDHFPDPGLELILPSGACLKDLALALAKHDPRLDALPSRCRFALEEEYVTLDQPLHAGANVAVLPPMSGG